MKKLLVLLISFIICNSSFSKATHIQGVDIKKLKNILANNEFRLERVKQGYFFKKGNDDSEKIITVYFDEEKPHETDMISYYSNIATELKEIKNNLTNNGFQLDEIDEYYFFEKRNGGFEERVEISFSDKKPYEIVIISRYINPTPSQEIIMKAKLKEMVEKINNSINNKLLEEEMIKALYRMSEISPKIRQGNKEDLKKIENHYEIGDYSIDTSNGRHEKTISLSCSW